MHQYTPPRPLTSSEFRDGPTQYRRPTDWICSLLFVCMWLSAAVIGVVYTQKSAPDISRPRDYDHNVCDQEYPLLYIASFDVVRTVCVKDCPTESGQLLQCKKNSMFRFCPVSREGLTVNNFYSLCHTKGIDIKIHTIKNNMGSFARAIIEGIQPISKTAVIITVVGLIMLLLTLFLPGITTWLYAVGFEIMLILLGILFAYIYRKGRLPYTLEQTEMQQTYITYMVLAVGCFAAVIISTITILARKNIANVRVVLILARAFMRSHWYIALYAIFLSGLSLAMLILLVHLLQMTQSHVVMNYLNHAAYDQLVRKSGVSIILIIFLAFVYLWTHGFMIALSNFIGEAMAAQWYFNAKNRLANEPTKQTGFFEVLKQVGLHFGTICYQGIVVYLPELVGSVVYGSASSTPCFWNYLSIYSFFQTVLGGYHFMRANEQSWHLLNRVRITCRDKYMLGHFYLRVAKAFIWAIAMLVCSWQMAKGNPYFFGHGLYLIPPLLVTTLLALQIGTHFSMMLGTAGDTIVIAYVADLQMSHKNPQLIPQIVKAFLSPVNQQPRPQ